MSKTFTNSDSCTSAKTENLHTIKKLPMIYVLAEKKETKLKLNMQLFTIPEL